MNATEALQKLIDARREAHERVVATYVARGKGPERYGPNGVTYWHAEPAVFPAREVARLLGHANVSQLGRELSRTPGVVRSSEHAGCYTLQSEVERAAAAKREIHNADALDGTTIEDLRTEALAELGALVARVAAKVAAAEPTDVQGLIYELRAIAQPETK